MTYYTIFLTKKKRIQKCGWYPFQKFAILIKNITIKFFKREWRKEGERK